MTEVYKFLHGLSPPIMGDIFCLRENTYNLRNSRPIVSRNVKSNIYGVTYKSSQLWNLVPSEIESLTISKCFIVLSSDIQYI